MITATATQHAKAGRESALEDLMKDLTAKVKANEPGCTIFLYVRSTAEPRTYLVIEQYADTAAFTLHHATPYLAAFVPKMMDCLEGPPEVTTFEDVFPS